MGIGSRTMQSANIYIYLKTTELFVFTFITNKNICVQNTISYAGDDRNRKNNDVIAPKIYYFPGIMNFTLTPIKWTPLP